MADNANGKATAFYGVISSENVLMGHRMAYKGIPYIVIPDGVEVIGTRSFEGEGIKSVFIPSSVKLIKEEAFNHCESISEITLSEGVECVDSWAFNSCYALKAIHIPASLTKFTGKPQPFNNCPSVKSITVAQGNPVFYAEKNCLIERAKKTLVTGCAVSEIPQNGSVEVIGKFAFTGLSKINKITLPDGLTKIDESAFNRCYRLTEINFPQSLKEIGDAAFFMCDLKTVAFGENLKSVGARAFDFNNNLTGEIVLSDKVTKLGHHAFEECAITKVTVGKGVKSIKEAVFKNCEKLTSVVLSEGITGIDKNAFLGCHALEKVVLPSTLKSIGKGAFAHCTNLKEITLPEGLTTIDKSAFEFCLSLETINMPSTVTYIGDRAFSDCRKLVAPALPPQPEYVGKTAFSGCKKRVLVPKTVSKPEFEIAAGELLSFKGDAVRVEIPEGVTKIKKGAFSKSKEIQTVVFSSTVSNVSVHAFDGCYNLISIEVDEGNKTYRAENNCLINKKKKAVVLGCNGKIGLIPAGVVEIGQYAFFNRTELESLLLPAGIKKISAHAFEGCANLKSVNFENGLETIEDGAFCGCTELENIILPDTLTTLGYSAFENCAKAVILRLSSGLGEISFNAFKGCENLDYLDVPEGVRSIDSQAFDNCNGFRYVSLPSTLKYVLNSHLSCNPKLEKITVAEGNEKMMSIGNCLIYKTEVYHLLLGCKNSVIPKSPEIRLIEMRAFKNCDIEEIVVPEGVIRVYASFNNCTKLKRVVFPKSLIQLGHDFEDFVTFVNCPALEEVYAPEKFRKHFKNINPKIKFTAVD